jgi:hypothetical protein
MLGMATDRVSGVSSARPAVAPSPMGITAQLADARAHVRSVIPVGASWEDVFAEVKRLQADRGLTMLAALNVVYGKLLAGWVPPRQH